MAFASTSGFSTHCLHHRLDQSLQLQASLRPAPARLACQSLAPGKQTIEPVLQQATAFAPATIANLGPGFDWMGCAVEVAASSPKTHAPVPYRQPWRM